MTLLFSIRTTTRYERLVRKLLKRHPELRSLQDRMHAVLSTDPHNRNGGHPIKKLEGAPPGQGQWRLALGRFRFRYDITGTVVELVYCGLRRENTCRDR